MIKIKGDIIEFGFCHPCNDNGRDHPAICLAWQIGGEWIPVCRAQAETWWDGADDPMDIDAPAVLFVGVG